MFADIFLRALSFFCNLAVLVELLLRTPVQQSPDAVCRRFTLFQFETIENYDHRTIEIFLLNFVILLLIEVEIVRSRLFVAVIGFCINIITYRSVNYFVFICNNNSTFE